MLIRRVAAAIASASVLTAFAAAPAPVMATVTGCAYADMKPTNGKAAFLSSLAVHCLVNTERQARGLPVILWNKKLATAAQSYANDMVARKYFSHEEPQPGIQDDKYRKEKAGYVFTGSWCKNENISWGTGPQTARQAFNGWMNEPFDATGHRSHREAILAPDTKDTGVGVAVGAPKAGVTAPSATFVQEFATTGATKSVDCG